MSLLFLFLINGWVFARAWPLLSSVADNIIGCWRRGALPLVLSSQQTVHRQVVDALVAKRVNVLVTLDSSRQHDWPMLLHRERRLLPADSLACFVVKGLPDSVKDATDLLASLHSHSAHALFTVSNSQVHAFLDLPSVQELLIVQPGLVDWTPFGAERIPRILLKSQDVLTESLVTTARENSPDKSLGFVIDLWRKEIAHIVDAMDTADTLNAALVPGVKHPDLVHWTKSDFAEFVSVQGTLRLGRVRDRLGRLGWSSQLFDPSIPFRPLKTTFPHAAQNPLFFLALLSRGHRVSQTDARMTTMEAFEQVETNNLVRTGNVKSPTSDGNFLEAVAAVAFFTASHRGSVDGSEIGIFCLRLVQEFLPEFVHRLHWKLGAEISSVGASAGLTRLVVPFLSPVNSAWPEVAGLGNLGNLVRPENEEMVDLVVENHGIYAEMKNHKRPLDAKTLLPIIGKMKADAKILFVITNSVADTPPVSIALAGWRNRVAHNRPLLSKKYRSTNLAVVKRLGQYQIGIEPLPYSDPVSDCNTLVLLIPIKDLVRDSSVV